MVDCYVIDGTNLYYRAYYSIPYLVTSYGRPVNAVYGVFRMLSKILNSGVKNIFIAFDPQGNTVRHSIYPQYKNNRSGPPEQLIDQIPLIYDLISHMGISSLKLDGIEADDIIGSMIKLCEHNNLYSYVMSTDYDMYQLISNVTSVYNIHKNKIIALDDVVTELGIRSSQVVDMLALAGDKSDSIPGVHGIGEKTAIKLLSMFGTLESIYKDLDRIKSNKLREKLKEGQENAFLSKRLATINRDIILPLTIHDIKYSGPDGLEAYINSLEFRQLAWGRFNEQKIFYND